MVGLSENSAGIAYYSDGLADRKHELSIGMIKVWDRNIKLADRTSNLPPQNADWMENRQIILNLFRNHTVCIIKLDLSAFLLDKTITN